MAEQTSRISRRTLFKKAGLVAGALAAPLVGGTGSALASEDARTPTGAASTLKLGLLLPQSQRFPGMSNSFLAGMRLYFGQRNGQVAGRQIQLVTREYGALPSAAAAQAEELVAGAGVGLLAGLLGAAIPGTLGRLLQERRVALVASSLGANVLRSGSQHPYVVHNSLGHWQASWALGRWAAQHVGTTALVASSFYESGYDADYAFQLGFEAGGGRVVKSVVTHQPNARGSVAALLELIKQTRPALVYAAYSAQQGTGVLRAFKEAGLDKSIALLGSGFLTDEAYLASQGSAALGVRTALAWARGLQTVENLAFVRAYRGATGAAPNAFAVLGYDAAHLIAQALAAREGDASADGLMAAFARASFASPRGPVAVDPATLELSGPLYLRQVRRGGAGAENVMAGKLAALPAGNGALAELRASLKTGWSYDYLAV
jgi:branched-chain amino acid transport system substrate-binding protein